MTQLTSASEGAMSDTPRTDAKRTEIYRDALGLEYEANELRNFCEQLERDLSAAVRERDEARAECATREHEVAEVNGLLADARAECEWLREDAERYRYLRDKQEWYQCYITSTNQMKISGDYDSLDEYVDAMLNAARRAG